MRNTIAATGCCVLLAACAPTRAPEPYALVTPYQDAEFQPYGRPGKAALHGQAFLKTVGGDVKTCAGNKVYLMPATGYNSEIIEHLPSPFSNRDARGDHFTKSTTCDAEGRFEFDDVYGAKWFVITDVTWGVPQLERGMFGLEVNVEHQGGMLLKPVDLQPGQNQVLLTDADRK